MFWEIPPKIKILEALGCIADERILTDGSRAKVFSSSRGKYYTVEFDENAIMSNDNGSYWKGYLGYPAIAYLMERKIIAYDPCCAAVLKGIAWKDLNMKFKNDFSRTEEEIYRIAEGRGMSREKLLAEVQKILNQLESCKLRLLGEKTRPPEGY